MRADRLHQTATKLPPALRPRIARAIATSERTGTATESYVQAPEGHGLDELSPPAYRLYCVLLSYVRPDRRQTRCWPSLEVLRRRMGRSLRGRQTDVKTVLRARAELEDAGLLIIEQRGIGHPVWRMSIHPDPDKNRTFYRLMVYVRGGKVIDEREEA